jgi:hypothetical protein
LTPALVFSSYCPKLIALELDNDLANAGFIHSVDRRIFFNSIQIIALALVYALIIRKPDQEDENERPDPEALGAGEEWVYPTRGSEQYTAECQVGYPPPDTEQLREAREERYAMVQRAPEQMVTL